MKSDMSDRSLEETRHQRRDVNALFVMQDYEAHEFKIIIIMMCADKSFLINKELSMSFQGDSFCEL